eukprot:13474798-Alexandrium_andersonii.AAC.1
MSRRSSTTEPRSDAPVAVLACWGCPVDVLCRMRGAAPAGEGVWRAALRACVVRSTLRCVPVAA